MRYQIIAWTPMPDGENDEVRLRASTKLGYMLKMAWCMVFYDYIEVDEF